VVAISQFSESRRRAKRNAVAVTEDDKRKLAIDKLDPQVKLVIKDKPEANTTMATASMSPPSILDALPTPGTSTDTAKISDETIGRTGPSPSVVIV
jgi:hypothetical protein